jgi:hypothetical protein
MDSEEEEETDEEETKKKKKGKGKQEEKPVYTKIGGLERCGACQKEDTACEINMASV